MKWLRELFGRKPPTTTAKVTAQPTPPPTPATKATGHPPSPPNSATSETSVAESEVEMLRGLVSRSLDGKSFVSACQGRGFTVIAENEVGLFLQGKKGRLALAVLASWHPTNIHSLVYSDSTTGEKTRLIIDGVVASAKGDAVNACAAPTVAPAKEPPKRKVLIVLPPMGHFDDEVTYVRHSLMRSGLSTEFASSRVGVLRGIRMGGIANVTLLMDDVMLSNYSAVIFANGDGTEDPTFAAAARSLVTNALGQGRTIASACMAMLVLGDSGVLRGRRITCYPDPELRSMLQSFGAVLTEESVVADGTVVTASYRSLNSSPGLEGDVEEFCTRICRCVQDTVAQPLSTNVKQPEGGRNTPLSSACVHGAHAWDGCRCASCGITRDAGHIYAACCSERCSKCGRIRANALSHSWGGSCMCWCCGQTRDQGHDWGLDSKKCARCDKIRDE